MEQYNYADSYKANKQNSQMLQETLWFPRQNVLLTNLYWGWAIFRKSSLFVNISSKTTANLFGLKRFLKNWYNSAWGVNAA